VDVARRVQAGEALDVVVLASNAIDKLIADGKALAGSRVDLVKSGVAIAVRAGAARPDIDTEEAVKCAVQAAKTLSYSTGPSGVYLEKMFERWGILADLRSRIVVPPPGVPVGRSSRMARWSGLSAVERAAEPARDRGGRAAASGHPEHHHLFRRHLRQLRRCGCSPRAAGVLASPAAAPVKQHFGMEAA